MNKEARDHLAAHRKYVTLEYAKAIGNNMETCRDFGVARSSFYEWKKAYAKGGKAGLLRKKPIARSHRLFSGFSNTIEKPRHLPVAGFQSSTRGLTD